MKKTIIIFGFINICLLLLLAGLFYLAEANPFRPGDPLFNLQSTAENERVRLTSDPLARARMSLRLVDRRLDNLTMAADPGQVELAVTALDQCLETAIWNVQALDVDQKENLAQASEPLLVRMDLILTGLDHQMDIQAFNTLKAKAVKLLKASQRETVAIKEPRPNIPAAITSKVIPFMDLKVDHGDFQMDGGHAELECLDCHQDGIYADKPNRCSDCHSFEQELLNLTDSNLRQFQIINSAYLQHDPGECSDCHALADWKTLIYEHPNVYECQSCHADDVPKVQVVHPVGNLKTISTSSSSGIVQVSTHQYPGDCLDCHSSNDTWSEITYDHHLSTCAGCHSSPSFQHQLPFKLECQRLETCTECHTDETHAGKYPGACTNCHTDVENWKNISVDHTQYPNCSLCHWDKKPAGHYPGLCSNCHSSTDWSLILFKHNPASNCATCHTPPSNHYDGQCNDCHIPAGWRLNVAFHTVSTCANCHQAPTGHYPDVCASCHVVQSWHTVTYKHIGVNTCTQCHTAPAQHYRGECINCHSTTTWAPTGFDHTGYTYCLSCHAEPEGHYPGVCLDCHTTSSWGAIIYVHSPTDDCETCHAAPTGHWPGDCANCHATGSWDQVTFDHTGYTDCKACHVRPTNHDRGQCSKCHSTDSWAVVIPTPTLTLPPTATKIPTATPLPTATLPPTDTPEPTATLSPTDSPEPTSTLEPTNTPEPTNTAEPTDTPEPTLELPEPTIDPD